MQSWEPYLTLTVTTAPYDLLLSYGVTVDATAEWVSIPLEKPIRLLVRDGRPAFFDLQLYAGSMCFYLRRRRKAGYSVREAEGVQAVYLPNATEPILLVSPVDIRVNLKQLKERG